MMNEMERSRPGYSILVVVRPAKEIDFGMTWRGSGPFSS